MYITQADIEAAIPSEELLQLADRDGDESADAAVVDVAIATAVAKVHPYLARRYQLPLDSGDALLMAFLKPGLVDLAWAALHPRADMVNDKLQGRVDKFLEQLADIRDGNADLPATGAPPTSGPSTSVIYSASERKTKGGLP